MSGKDDKPLYIQGPSDSPARVETILRALEARCGEGGYHYIVAADDFEPLDIEEENGENAITGPIGRAGLEAMAVGLLASRPGSRFGSIRRVAEKSPTGKLFGYVSEQRFRQSEHTLEHIFQALEATFTSEDERRRAKLAISDHLVLDAVIGNTDIAQKLNRPRASDA